MICGLDEAGRGALAGPVCAAAAILHDDFPVEVLNDSKKLNAAQREYAAAVIKEKALAWAVGWAEHTEIDKINILRASLLAMRRAFMAMSKKLPWPGHDFEKEYGKYVGDTVIDGLFIPELPVPCRALVKADTKIPAVMAASILAKTSRDAKMVKLSVKYPLYHYEKHKGYPTKGHKTLIAVHGLSPIQRLSFKHWF